MIPAEEKLKQVQKNIMAATYEQTNHRNYS